MKYGDRRGATALRLLMVLRSLQRGSRLRSRVQSEHGIGHRTMRRDLALLREAGFVITAERVHYDDEPDERLRLEGAR